MEEKLIRFLDVSFIDISAYVGLAAAGFMTVNLLIGLLLSIQYSPVTSWPHFRIPLFAIHKWTGYSALFLALLLPLWLPLANGSNFSVLAVFYPLITTEQPILTSLGALSAYTLLFVVVTAYLRNKFEYVTWKKIHYASYFVIVSFLIHGIFTEPSLKPGADINYFDGGKLFIEACALICICLVVWRISIGGQIRRKIADPTWRGQLVVSNIFDVAKDVKVFRLVNPLGTKLPFRFLPGQYLSFHLLDGDRTFTRSYSICSAPQQEKYCEIGVKRNGEAGASAHLHEDMEVGSTLTCIGPLGGFTFTGAEADSIVLIAGGIGITPFLCVLQHLAHSQWPHEVFLVFAVSSPEKILFEKELRELAQMYRQFKFIFLPSNINGFKWEGPSGRLTSTFLTDFIPEIERRRIHLCGPEQMMFSAVELLHSLNVPPAQIHTESFGNQNIVSIDGLSSSTVTFVASEKSCFAPAGMTLLDAAEQCGVAIESLCRTGTCGTCKVKLVAGNVVMQRDAALTKGDIRHQFVLACQARSVTSEIRLQC